MTPSARLAAAIEVLDAVAASTAPAEDILKAWGRAHRFAGSKDRRAIGEEVYAVLRARTRLAWSMGAEGGRDLVLARLREAGSPVAEVEALFDGVGHAPASLTADERVRFLAPSGPPPDQASAGVPPFMVPVLQHAWGEAWWREARALTGDRAPLDLRVNALRGEVGGAVSLLKTDGLEPARTPWSARGLRLPPELAPDVARLRAFSTGWVEVQDEASQVAAALAGAAPGMTVVDYCAGGGGKALALGGVMRAGRSGAEPGTRLVASDVNPRRLEAMAPRLQRADVVAEVRRLGPAGEGMDDLAGRADLVFVDAPCSGSGTWRRHPEGAWRLTAEAVARLVPRQRAILDQAAALVRPGGRLAYATCSVLPAENGEVAAAFELEHPGFRPLPVAVAVDTPELTDAARARLPELAAGSHMLQLSPHRTGTDGFFLALFERTA